MFGLGPATNVKGFLALIRVDGTGFVGIDVTVVVYGYTEEMNGDLEVCGQGTGKTN